MNIGLHKIALFLACCTLPFTLIACGDDSSSVDSPEDVQISLSSSEEDDSSSSGKTDSKAKSSSSKETKLSSSKADSTSTDEPESSTDTSSTKKTNSSSSKENPKDSSDVKVTDSTAVESSSSQESSSSEILKVPTTSFTDSRDGKTYKLVNINGQIWMAEDLQYGDSSLYTFMDAEVVCPQGFHLPSMQEFEALVEYAGGMEVAAKKLKSTTGWPNDSTYGDWNGTDDYGFNAKPVESGNGTGTDENFWTTMHNFYNYASVNIFKIEPHPTSKMDSTAPQPQFGDFGPFCYTRVALTSAELSSLACFINAEPDSRISVRCLSNIQECNGTAFDNTKQFCQDGAIYDICQRHQYDGTKYECRNDTIYERGTDSVYKISWKILNPQKTYGLFQDPRDGQYYKTITVEGSTWFAENLNYDVPGSICYDNKPSYCDIYGRMYTQKQALGGIDTVPDRRTEGICPPGTHLVTLAEYNALQEAYSTEDMFSSYVEYDLTGEFGTFTNNSGVSLLFGGYYSKNARSSYYLEEWSEMSRAGYLIGSEFTYFFYHGGWPRTSPKNYYRLNGEPAIAPDDDQFGSVRCVVNYF